MSVQQLSNVWFLDSSVVLRALINNSGATKSWLSRTLGSDDEFFGSRMLELEVRRVIRNAGADQRIADPYLSKVQFVAITSDLVTNAMELPFKLGAADALHIATANLLESLAPIVVTHDAQMARAIQSQGMLSCIDPVTDDPLRPPVC
jgi:predicted nucleic acid-binding protein